MVRNEPKIITDTPNILFYNKNRGREQIEKNIAAFLNLILLRLDLIATITPKMRTELPNETTWLITLIKSNGGKIIETKPGEDPDAVALKKSEELKAPILTNDKFQDEKYAEFKSKWRVICFRIRENMIVIKSKFWKKFLKIEDTDDEK